jgi:hypothetical protein
VSGLVDVYEISAVVAAAGVLVGVAYYILDMRNQTKIRKTDLFMRLWEFGTTDQMMGAFEKFYSLQFKDYKDYVAKYGSFLSENPTQRAVWRGLGFYSLLGVLVYKKLLDLELVYHLAGPEHTTMLYERFKPIIMELRRDLNEPLFGMDFEYLINEFARDYPQTIKTWKKRQQEFKYLNNEMKKRGQRK